MNRKERIATIRRCIEVAEDALAMAKLELYRLLEAQKKETK